jgi:hypothetical protein
MRKNFFRKTAVGRSAVGTFQGHPETQWLADLITGGVGSGFSVKAGR